LDLLRHGEAVPVGTGDDAGRALSDRGRKTIARLAEEFGRRGWKPRMIFTSPLQRARETASIVIEAAAPDLTYEVLEELSPEGEPEDLVEALLSHRIHDHVMLVGHQPLLGRLATHLTGKTEFRLPAGGLLRLACTEPLGTACASLELELEAGGVA
jgi:phosphohistidine phosphatase